MYKINIKKQRGRPKKVKQYICKICKKPKEREVFKTVIKMCKECNNKINERKRYHRKMKRLEHKTQIFKINMNVKIYGSI